MLIHLSCQGEATAGLQEHNNYGSGRDLREQADDAYATSAQSVISVLIRNCLLLAPFFSVDHRDRHLAAVDAR